MKKLIFVVLLSGCCAAPKATLVSPFSPPCQKMVPCQQPPQLIPVPATPYTPAPPVKTASNDTYWKSLAGMALSLWATGSIAGFAKTKIKDSLIS